LARRNEEARPPRRRDDLADFLVGIMPPWSRVATDGSASASGRFDKQTSMHPVLIGTSVPPACRTVAYLSVIVVFIILIGIVLVAVWDHSES
jgi:hypothetical protein